MKAISVIVLAFVISGCSVFGQRISEEVADVVDKYCEEPQNAREVYREQVNAELSQYGHSIQVTCAGDSDGN